MTLTGDCELDCQETCAYPGRFSECSIGTPVPNVQWERWIIEAYGAVSSNSRPPFRDAYKYDWVTPDQKIWRVSKVEGHDPTIERVH